MSSGGANNTTGAGALGAVVAQIRLRWLQGNFSICRLPPHATLNPQVFAYAAPDLPGAPDFVGVIKTKDELSVLARSEVCAGGWVEKEQGKVDGGWLALEVQGPMAFDVVSELLLPTHQRQHQQPMLAHARAQRAWANVIHDATLFSGVGRAVCMCASGHQNAVH